MKKLILFFSLIYSIVVGQTYNFNGTQTFKSNVGIGTATPTKKLEVIGTIKGDSIQATRLKITTGASNGYLLKSDANGNTSWANPSTLGITGPTGATGATGADGQSASYYEYQASTSLSLPPASGRVTWNNATQSSATNIYINHVNSNGVDVEVLIGLLQSGNKVILQDANNSANYQKWTVNGSVTVVSNSYIQIPVNSYVGTYSFPNNHSIIVAIVASGAQGATGPTGANGATGATGATGGVSGLTVGSTTITSGTSGRIPYNNSGVYDEDAGLTYSSANKRLTLGGTTATIPLIARNSTWSTNFIVNSNNGRSSGAIGFWNDALSSAMRMSILYRTEFSIVDENAGAANMYIFPTSTYLVNQVSVKTGSAPTAHLHIAAGTASSGNAPLKLTAGTNLTTPENGAFEFDGSFLYFTLGGTRYKVTLTP